MASRTGRAARGGKVGLLIMADLALLTIILARRLPHPAEAPGDQPPERAVPRKEQLA